MSKNVERIIVAGLLSYIGVLVSLHFFGPGILWVKVTFGLIAFVAGYIGYDFREFLSAIPVAFREACAGMQSWIPTCAGLKRFARFAFYTFGAGASITVTFFGAILLVISPPPTEFVITSLQWAAYFGIFGGLTFMFIASSSFKTEDSLQRHIEAMSHVIQLFHPILFVVRTAWIGIFYALLGVAWMTEKGCEFGWRFAYHLYYLVHSRGRVLFGIDVAIGFSVGYQYGNPLLGGICGIAFWVLDWHLISIKLMQVQRAE